ncbi:MAG TPA: DUF2249 domain-containing protein [Candidatus Tumulicola sp.]|jgi:uncharacterized protein (DUF2249 family)
MQPHDVHLDVRSIPPPQRHRQIFALFASLRDGQALLITSDHEPRPLRAEFDRLHGIGFGWAQRQLGDGRWEVRIVRSHELAPDSPIESTLIRSSVFADIPRAGVLDLSHYVRRAAIKRHHCVAEQGVLWPYVGVVESGIVQTQLITAGGREQAIYDVLPGEIFGETALFDRGHMALRYIALTADTVVLLLPIERVRALADGDRSVRRRLQEAAAQHTRAILKRFSAQVSLSATARVATVLLPYASPEPGLADALDPLPAMTQVELATCAGTVKEVVSRAVAELEIAGALLRDGGHIAKLDRDKLLKEAERGS